MFCSKRFHQVYLRIIVLLGKVGLAVTQRVRSQRFKSANSETWKIFYLEFVVPS